MSGYRERRFTAQDGLSLYFRDYGGTSSGDDAPGIPVLCLPGLTRNSNDFDRLATWLSSERTPRHRVICPDYRGRGRSDYDPDWDHYTPPVYLSDLRAMLTVLNVHRFVAIGTSLGGLLANGLGVLSPSSVAGVVMNDIGPEVGSDGLGRITDFIAEDKPQPDWETAIAFLKASLPNLGLDSEDDWRRAAEGTFREGDGGLLHFDWDVNLAKPLAGNPQSRLDLWALFRALKGVPVGVVRGGNSDILSQETAKAMAAAHPDLTLAVIPGKGHTPTLSEPGSREVIDAVLDKATAAGGIH